MPVERLALTDFRNHRDALILPGAALPASAMIVLTGDNGAGKTNILEAVSLLAPGRGLRGVALRDMARQDGPGGFGIAADVAGARIGTGTLAATPDRRQVRVNGTAAAATALAEHLAISWLTPAMDRLFIESPGGRRRFLDRLVLALRPDHGTHSARYEAAMRARNALLAEERPADPEWLAALEAQMDAHGHAIDMARRHVLARLGQVLGQTDEDIFARPRLALDGWTGAPGALAAALRSGRGRDAGAGRTLTGPHRADLIVTHADKGQAAALCSTGEQKALLLSLILAHAAIVGGDTGRPLVVLLDEVAAHLDPARRIALFDRLRATGGQVWMTGTEAALFDGIGAAARFIVDEGQVVAG
ncbi:DNA replication/repair protein RecF [Sphingobium sufflavum]|uniref:DNA replication/repair protein RecF n=1 Tax=Sphingobium sufflavum TaxID=1129547 RepID=UPI001F2E6037|nr:DNA replication/repair protein RecF [Sphingobium sufflavum]MCE7797675.1 DNA replication/repair protein RecF [Sphingobium sufflavum]